MHGISDARAALLALGALLVLASAVPYVSSIVGGRTRPRMLSWIVWTLLGAIATVAAYTEGEHSSAALTAAATFETGSIVVLGWRYGNHDFERLDAYCLAGVITAVLSWALLESPMVGLIAALSIDIIAAIPTVRHAWRKPHEEAVAAYVLCAVAPLCFLAATPKYTLTGLLYPAYLLTMNAAIAVIILRVARPRLWFRPARPSSPDMPVHAHDPTVSTALTGAEVVLTYGRHSAGISTGPALIIPASPAPKRHAAQPDRRE